MLLLFCLNYYMLKKEVACCLLLMFYCVRNLRNFFSLSASSGHFFCLAHFFFLFSLPFQRTFEAHCGPQLRTTNQRAPTKKRLKKNFRTEKPSIAFVPYCFPPPKIFYQRNSLARETDVFPYYFGELFFKYSRAFSCRLTLDC